MIRELPKKCINCQNINIPDKPAKLAVCWRSGAMRDLWTRRECEDYFLTTLYQLVLRYDLLVKQNGELK